MGEGNAFTIAALNAEEAGEKRVAITPQSAGALTKLGLEVAVQSGVGAAVGAHDKDYADAGAQVLDGADKVLAKADMLFGYAVPKDAHLDKMKKGAIYAGLMDPYLQPEGPKRLAAKGIDALALDLVPRTSYAQKMDALSSQASLAGYQGVVEAAAALGKALPMMTTAAGAITPARVLVLGVGVAGLQAIATAKRLGAQVSAYDVRPVVAEQVKSLGAKFLQLDLGEGEETKDGYAKGLTDEQLAEQRRQLTEIVKAQDIVITAAQVFGRKAPILMDKGMVAAMKRGAIIVDLASATGGNVEGTVPGEDTVTDDGVRIFAHLQYAARAPADASRMYANNLAHLIDHLWDKEAKTLRLDPEEDPILDAVLIVRDGKERESRAAEKAREAASASSGDNQGKAA